MEDQIALGVLAVLIGVFVGVLLFVPFVAVSYRRRGGLSFWRFVGWAAALIYFWAIWTYTLLPLPDPDELQCRQPNLDLLAFIDDIQRAIAAPGSPLTNPLILQLVLNVALFLPLGFFVRVLGGRGVVVATLIGLGVSLFIETTQLTGVWGLYPCAYRVFDVDDLLTNTLGALLGALVAFAVPKHHRGFARSPDAGEPDPVTRGRRFVAMLCDCIGAVVLQVVLAIGVQLLLFAVGEERLMEEGQLAGVLSSGLTAALWLGIALGTGRTIGDLAVQLRYTGSTLPTWLSRTLRWLGGIGGFLLVGMLPGSWAQLNIVFLLACAVLLFTTKQGRGLPGLISGQGLIDARSREAVSPGTPAR